MKDAVSLDPCDALLVAIVRQAERDLQIERYAPSARTFLDELGLLAHVEKRLTHAKNVQKTVDDRPIFSQNTNKNRQNVAIFGIEARQKTKFYTYCATCAFRKQRIGKR